MLRSALLSISVVVFEVCHKSQSSVYFRTLMHQSAYFELELEIFIDYSLPVYNMQLELALP